MKKLIVNEVNDFRAEVRNAARSNRCVSHSPPSVVSYAHLFTFFFFFTFLSLLTEVASSPLSLVQGPDYPYTRRDRFLTDSR
jgi:hypothetical protein